MPEYIPDDPLFAQQWHLRNTGQVSFAVPGIDLNVTQVWPDYTGLNVHVGVYDNGVDYNHPDLNDNYDASLEVTFNGNPVDPIWQASPDPSRYNEFNGHGTAIAGAIAAEDNDIGVVGVAFGAQVTGVLAPFGGNPPDDQLVDALDQLTNFDIATFARINGLLSDGRGNPNFSSFWAAIDNAVANGRDGLGTILVRGANNTGPGFGGEDGNESAFRQDHTLVVAGAVQSNGLVAPYVVRGSNILVSGLSGFAATGDPHNILTTDISGSPGQDPGDYVTGGGTSLSHPLVAGVVALMLEANPNLGWRDVQTILSSSARHVGGSNVGDPPNSLATETDGWTFNNADNWNGGGRHFSNDYGYGLVDALAAVRMAETWHVTGTAAATSANQAFQSATTNPGGSAIPDNDGNSVSFSFTVGSNIRVESARVFFNLTHARMEDLHMTLTSPSGTVSEFWNPPIGDGTQGTHAFPSNWAFVSQEFRGELTAGTWTVTIEDLVSGNAGTLGTSATLQLRGSTAAVANNRYVYTNEFSDYADLTGRATLTDTDGGIDTINASAVTLASTINLNAGVTGSIDGHSFTVATGSTIENAIGGDGDDALTGNNAANVLYGGRGNDTLVGGMGSDSSGFSNTLDSHTVVRNGVLTTVTGPEGTDHLTAVETFDFTNVDLRNIFFTGNFDGGVSGDDIALQNGSDTAFWLMDGTSIQPGSGNLPTLGSGWVAIGAGDLSGNGTDDLVLLNGQDVAVWQMNGTTIDVGSGNIGTLGAGWMVTGIADLNGGGIDDLVLQNGQTLAVWQMTGTTIGPGSGNIGTLGAGWAVAGTGDFNDDGTDDLLLQNGQDLAVWHMNGTTILGTSGNIGTLGSGWMVAGVADTDGDNNADIILQNGQDLAVWLMVGTVIQPGSGNIGTLGSGWTIAGNGDFNADGHADLLLQNGSTLAEWHLTGTTILPTSGNVGTLGAGWDLL